MKRFKFSSHKDLMAHGFTTTQPPLARRLARFARVALFHVAEPPPGLRGLVVQMCPRSAPSRSSVTGPPAPRSPPCSLRFSPRVSASCRGGRGPRLYVRVCLPAASRGVAKFPASPVSPVTLDQQFAASCRTSSSPPVAAAPCQLATHPAIALPPRTRCTAAGRAGRFVRFRKEQFFTGG